jgi:hypothetical protein
VRVEEERVVPEIAFAELSLAHKKRRFLLFLAIFVEHAPD